MNDLMEITSQIESLKISSDDNLVNAYGLLKQVKAMKKEAKKSQDSIVKEAKKPYDKALQERKEAMKPYDDLLNILDGSIKEYIENRDKLLIEQKEVNEMFGIETSDKAPKLGKTHKRTKYRGVVTDLSKVPLEWNKHQLLVVNQKAIDEIATYEKHNLPEIPGIEWVKEEKIVIN